MTSRSHFGPSHFDMTPLCTDAAESLDS